MGLTSLGNILAPSLGPVLGGLITSHYGWRGVFCFLAGGGVVVLLVLVFFLPETRKARANALEIGSVERGQAEGAAPDDQRSKRKNRPRLPNPLTPLRLLAHFPTSLVLLSNGLVFASYYAVTAGIPSQFARIYGLSDMGVGLVFLPAGVGSLVSATFNGAVVDWNYRRVRRVYEDAKSTAEGDNEVNGDADGTESDREFPVERARLQVGGPMTVSIAGVYLVFLHQSLMYS
jgi:predicted MFS family arabinose efflux permease